MEKCPFPHDSGAPSEKGKYPEDGSPKTAAACPFPGSASQEGWSTGLEQAVEQHARHVAPATGLPEERAVRMARAAIEERAGKSQAPEITAAFVRQLEKKMGYGHPLSEKTGTLQFVWTDEARKRLENVPEFCRELTRWRVEWTASKLNLGNTITPEIMEKKYEMWGKVSKNIETRSEDRLPWTDEARARFERIPEFVRGQVLDAVEGNARSWGLNEIDSSTIDRVIRKWVETGDFHEGMFGFK